MNNPILILGASDELVIPELECEQVFTANSSAINGKIYKDKFQKCIHTNITPAKAFNKIEEIKKSVLEAEPDFLISRFGKIENDKFIELKNTNYSEFNEKDQFNFQKKFLEKNVHVYLTELNYKQNFFEKLIHLKQCLTWRGFLGCSTGLFATIIAMDRNPKSDVILSGIDFKGGGYFQGARKQSSNRASADLYFLKKLKKIQR